MERAGVLNVLYTQCMLLVIKMYLVALLKHECTAQKHASSNPKGVMHTLHQVSLSTAIFKFVLSDYLTMIDLILG